ncbi:MAG: TfoX/Sxy family protein [Bacteroidales bacterium]|nr:TfoX/Sxy family protein [Bacteroidales bacterium]MBN2763798.1 TfoX/Sxy family protein [Bacteroidales bacterium]
MKSDLSNHINIGKDTETKLIQAGIDTFEKLRSTGCEQAFIRLQVIDPGACLSLLYGLDGAINGIRWNKLPTERKQELQQFYKMVKKQSFNESPRPDFDFSESSR